MSIWKPIATAPKDRRIVVWRPTEHTDSRHDVVKWSADEYSKKPRPYWKSLISVRGAAEQRSSPPTHWCDFPEGPDEGDSS